MFRFRSYEYSNIEYYHFSQQSVLQQANSLVAPATDHLLTTIQEHYGHIANNKKQGVSGQSMDPAKTVQLQKVEKDIR